MPELPEVEATARYLDERVSGELIRAVEVGWPRTVSTGCSPEEFRNAILGHRIEAVFRRGKFVVMRLIQPSRELFVFTHLRMSGSFDVVSQDAPPSKHDRVVFHFESGKTARFNDPRKFGRMYLGSSVDYLGTKVGLEPLGPDFTPDRFTTMVKARRGAIKPLLLTQSFVAGLGNIYVDESLWKAGIHPRENAAAISKRRLEALHGAIVETLSEAVELLGTDFGDNVVHGGMYQPSVYGREGEPCKRCGTTIKRLVVGQRGTHICSRCQRRR